MGRKSLNVFVIFLIIFLPGSLLFFLALKIFPSLQIALAFLPSKYRKYTALAIAQAKHETGNFTSHVFKSYHNAFGMGNATQRKQSGQPSPDPNYRQYSSTYQSARDLIAWMKEVNFTVIGELTPEAYTGELKAHGYFTAPYETYLNGIINFLA